MYNHSDTLLKLRERIAQKTKEWLSKNIFEYLPLQADLCDLSPDKFIEVKQYKKFKSKQFDKQIYELDTGIDGYLRDDRIDDFQIEFARIDILKVIEENPRLVILGDPGLGKTTSLQYITLLYSNDNNKPIPIYLELKYYSHQKDFKKFICPFTDIDLEDFREQEFIFFLDGFNELASDEQGKFLIDLHYLLSDYSSSNFVITSRKNAYPYGSDINDWPTCELLELENTRIKKYLRFVFNENRVNIIWRQIKKQNLLDVARIPQFLDFICHLIKLNQPLPNTKGGLLNEIVLHKYLSKESRDKIIEQTPLYLQNIPQEEILSLISLLAHHVFELNGRITFDRNLLERVLEKEFQNKVWDIVKLFEHLRLIEKYEIRDKEGLTQTIYSFWHQSFFEYFAGYNLKRIFEEVINDDKKELFKKALPYFEFFKWDEPIKIALSLCDTEKADLLFSIALEQDIFLALKYLSAIENRPFINSQKALEKKLDYRLTNWPESGKKTLFTVIGQSGCSSLVPYLNMQLAVDDKFYKEASNYFLGQIGSSKAISYLIERLNDNSSDVRKQAAIALGNIGDSKAVPHLKKLFNDDNMRVFGAAAEALGKIGDLQASQFLIGIFEKEYIDYHMLADHMLFYINYNLGTLDFIIREKDDYIFKSAYLFSALSKIHNSQVISNLIKQLKDNSSDVRMKAAIALSIIGDSKAVLKLEEMLKDNNDEVRMLDAIVLGIIGNPKAISSLIKMLTNNNDDIRILAILALGNIGKKEAATPIIKMLNDNNDEIRKVAAISLGNIRNPKAIIPLMQLLYKEKDYFKKKAAIEALSKIGTIQAIKTLILCLKKINDKEDIVKYLVNISNSDVVPFLIEMLEDTNIENSQMAAKALGEIGNSDAVEHLIKIIENYNNNEGNVRIVSKTLYDILHLRANLEGCSYDVTEEGELLTKAPLPSVPFPQKGKDITDDWNDENFKIRNFINRTKCDQITDSIKESIRINWSRQRNKALEAAVSLGKIGDRRAVEPLINMLKDFDSVLTMIAAVSLGKIGDKGAVKPLIDMLMDDDKSKSSAAVRALGEIGDPLAIPSLIKCLKDESLRQGSFESLGEILAKLSVDNWHEELMKEILSLKNKAYQDDVCFRMFYNLQLITGRRFIDIKKPSIYDVTIKQEEKSTSDRYVQGKVTKEYDIWKKKWEDDANDANEEEINNFQKTKTLFVDADQCLVYSNGGKITKLENSNQSYNILVCILKHKGTASPDQIFEIIYPDSRVKKTSSKKKYIRSPVSRLRSILKNYGIILSRLRGSAYCLDNSDFVLAKKKNNI